MFVELENIKNLSFGELFVKRIVQYLKIEILNFLNFYTV